MQSERKILTLIPGKDFFLQATKGSGPGGQNRNKNSTAIILTHPASGVVIRASEHKSQLQNKKAALKRLIQSDRFKIWLRMETAARELGYANLEAKVDEMISERNLKIEYFDPGGKNTDRT